MEVVVLGVTKEDQTSDDVDKSWRLVVSLLLGARAAGWECVRIADGFLPK